MLNIRNISLALITLLAISCPPALHSAIHYAFKQIVSDEGLSSSYVKAIAQDSNGFIWLGTKNGLDRFDGVSIRAFNCHDPKAERGNNNIGAIYEDADRNLWIGTDRGVYIFNPRTESFTVFDAESRNGVRIEDWVQTIKGDPSGNIWILVPNQGVFRYREDKIEYYSVTSHNGDKEKLPLSLLVTDAGNIYVGTNRQGIYFYDNQTNMFRKLGSASNDFSPFDGMTVQCLAELPDGSICAATRQGAMLRITPSTQTVSAIPFSGSGKLVVHDMRCIGNELWLASTDGIFTIDIHTGAEGEISKQTMGRRSLSDNTVTYLFLDRDSNVWAGTMFGGVNFIQRSGLIFEKYGADITRRGLTSNHIRGLATDSEGKIWVGTEEAGLNILDPATGDVTRLPSTSPDNKITLCLKAIDDKVYAGFVRGGCVVMQGGTTARHTRHEPAPGSQRHLQHTPRQRRKPVDRRLVGPLPP